MNHKTICPFCGIVCTYRTTSIGRWMPCPECRISFRRPAPYFPGLRTGQGVGCLAFLVIVILLPCGGLCLSPFAFIVHPTSTHRDSEYADNPDSHPRSPESEQKRVLLDNRTPHRPAPDLLPEQPRNSSPAITADKPSTRLSTWIDKAREEITAAREARSPQEPLPKPSTMAASRYQAARTLAGRWLEGTTAMNVRFVLYLKSPVASDALELVPASARRWRREAYWQALHDTGGKTVDSIVAADPALSPLKATDLQQVLRARLPWNERQSLYNEFAEITGEKRFWTLTHPFDDLDGAEMKAAIKAARRAKTEGLSKLEADARHLLLKGDAIDYFQRLLDEAERLADSERTKRLKP